MEKADVTKITYVDKTHGTMYFSWGSWSVPAPLSCEGGEAPSKQCGHKEAARSQEEQNSETVQLPLSCRFFIAKREIPVFKKPILNPKIVSRNRRYFVDKEGERVSSENVVKVPIFYEGCPSDKSEQKQFEKYKEEHPEERVYCYMMRDERKKLRMVHHLKPGDNVLTSAEYTKMWKPSKGRSGPLMKVIGFVRNGTPHSFSPSDIGKGNCYYICATGTETLEEGKRVRYCTELDFFNWKGLRNNVILYSSLLKAMERKKRGMLVAYRYRIDLQMKYYVCTPSADREGWMIMIPFPFAEQRTWLKFPRLGRADPIGVKCFERLLQAKRSVEVTSKVIEDLETSAALHLQGHRKTCKIPNTEGNIRLLLQMNPEESTREVLQGMLESKYQTLLPNGTIDPSSGDPARKAVEDLHAWKQTLGGR